jgi:hypothetical protein
MKRKIILVLVLITSFATATFAEDTASKPDAAQTADDLRLKLIDVQAKEAELEARARRLEEDSKPENIERSLAGIGSTKPEELRELRRRQMSIELEGVRNQLKILATSRERLETAIRTADANAYQQGAAGPILPAAQVLKGDSTTPWFLIAAGSLGALALVLLVVMIRKAKTTF